MKKVIMLFLLFVSSALVFSQGAEAVVEATKIKLVVPQEEQSEIYSIAWSPDGKYIASTVNPVTASDSYRISLWNAQTGELIRTLKGHTDVVWSVAFSPDGKYLASGSADRTLKLWNVRTGELVEPFKDFVCHDATVSFVTFDKNGNFIATGSKDATMKFWDMCTGEMCAEFTGHTDTIASIAYSNHFMASASWDNTINLYYTFGTTKIVDTLKGHTDKVFGVSWSPDGKFLASGSKDTTVKIWDINARNETQTLSGFKGAVWDVKYNPAGTLLAGGADDGTVRVFEVSSGKPVAVFNNDGVPVRYVAWSPDGSKLLSGGSNGIIRLWDFSDSKCLVSMFEDNSGDWISWNSNGYFVANESSFENLVFSVDGTEYRPGQTAQTFCNPLVISNTMENSPSGEDSSMNTNSLLEAVKQTTPPDVKLFVQRDKETKRKIGLNVVVTDAGDGIGVVLLNINGRTVFLSRDEHVTKKGDEISFYYEAVLNPGDNTIGASAYDAKNVFRSSFSDNNLSTLPYSGTPELPRLYFLALACDDFMYLDSLAEFGSGTSKKIDANRVARSFVTHTGNAYSDVFVSELYNSDVTIDKVKEKIDFIAKEIQPSDVFVLYLSGRCKMLHNSNFYFVPSLYTYHDFEADSTENLLNEYAISKDFLVSELSKIHTLNCIVFMDLSQSGTGENSFSTVSSVMRCFEYDSGCATVATVNTGSMFSYYIVEGMNGEADKNSDSIVSVKELSDYLSIELNNEPTLEYTNTLIHPSDRNFVLFGINSDDSDARIYQFATVYDKQGQYDLALEWYNSTSCENAKIAVAETEKKLEDLNAIQADELRNAKEKRKSEMERVLQLNAAEPVIVQNINVDEQLKQEISRLNEENKIAQEKWLTEQKKREEEWKIAERKKIESEFSEKKRAEEARIAEEKRKEEERIAELQRKEKEVAEQKQREEEKRLAENRSKPLVFVEGGEFLMGNDSGESDESPVHKVSVSSFFISNHEVTQAEWKAVMGKNPSVVGGDNDPVENISWFDAVKYCNELSKKDGFIPCYDIYDNGVKCDLNANGYRLPTEVEWEYAARGGNKSKGYNYSGSNDIKNVAWFVDNAKHSTFSVDAKTPNELGIYDMSGNVSEWCWDFYTSYSSDESFENQHTGSLKVVRGGSWYNGEYSCRVSSRFFYNPADSNITIGFRVVRNAE